MQWLIELMIALPKARNILNNSISFSGQKVINLLDRDVRSHRSNFLNEMVLNSASFLTTIVALFFSPAQNSSINPAPDPASAPDPAPAPQESEQVMVDEDTLESLGNRKVVQLERLRELNQQSLLSLTLSREQLKTVLQSINIEIPNSLRNSTIGESTVLYECEWRREKYLNVEKIRLIAAAIDHYAEEVPHFRRFMYSPFWKRVMDSLITLEPSEVVLMIIERALVRLNALNNAPNMLPATEIVPNSFLYTLYEVSLHLLTSIYRMVLNIKNEPIEFPTEEPRMKQFIEFIYQEAHRLNFIRPIESSSPKEDYKKGSNSDDSGPANSKGNNI